MKVPAFILLLPLLLLSDRSAAAKLDILAPNSIRANSTCPNAAAIAPCVCLYDTAGNVYLDCTLVESEEQLAAVFQQEFPVTALSEFFMGNNDAISVLGNFVSGVTFQSIRLEEGPFVLEQITESFISDSVGTLTNIKIMNSQLTSDNFPFELLSMMESLEILYIDTSLISSIPPLTAPSSLYLVNGLTDVIEAGTFGIPSGHVNVYLYGNQITTIEAGSFYFASTSGGGQVSIDLSGNQIQALQAASFPIKNGMASFNFDRNQIASIEPGTFSSSGSVHGMLSVSVNSNLLQSLQAGTFPLKEGENSFQFADNQIASIEAGTFVLPGSADEVSLSLDFSTNALTTVDEAVFGELMPFTTLLGLEANPLSCGCDIAWLVLNPTYLGVVGGTCADGTNLQDLDPQYFTDNC